MAKEQSSGKPTTLRYSPEEKAAAVRMVHALRAELGTAQGTVQRVTEQLGYGVESVGLLDPVPLQRLEPVSISTTTSEARVLADRDRADDRSHGEDADPLLPRRMSRTIPIPTYTAFATA